MKTIYKNILITGATGSLGKRLCNALVNQGLKPIAHCRASSNREYVKSLGLEIREADMRNPEQLRRAVEGVDAVIHTAAIVNFRGDRLTQFTGVNTMGAVDLYRAAQEAGVKRFVQVSSVVGIGAVQKQKLAIPMDETADFNLGHLRIPYILSKQAAETELLKLAETSATELVIVNPSIIVAASRSGDDRGKAMKLMSKPILPTVGCRFNLVDQRDVTSGILAALENGKHCRRYILAGENITLVELLNQVANRLGKRPITIKLPRWIAITAAHLNALICALFNRPIRRLYPDLIRMMDYDWIYDSSQAQEELGFDPRPLSETLDDLLSNNFTG